MDVKTETQPSEAAMRRIQPIELPLPGIEQLQREALDEGYKFIERLVAEWSSGENRFNAPGEILCGCMDQGVLVAVGGLNRDPFVALSDVGRIRRVYVRPAWRNKGIGEALITTLVENAQKTFRCVRLRAEDRRAAQLYERIGFSPNPDSSATHLLTFDKTRTDVS
jgi:GNAT superfamily N-acetyltransferase